MPTARGRYRASPATLADAAEADLLLDDTGKLQIAGSFVVDSEFPAAAALADNTANPTTTCVASMLMCFDGTTWDRAQCTAASTGATRAQPGLVVSVSPNSPWTRVDQNTAANGWVAKGSAGFAHKVWIEIGSTVASQVLYLTVTDETTVNSAAGKTLLHPPVEWVHVLGSVDIIPLTIDKAAAAGVVVSASSTGGTTTTLVAAAITGWSEVSA